jgi:aminomethyltransferase
VVDTTVARAGLDRFVNLDAPADFIGKAALLKVREQGITRKLVGIRILSDTQAAAFEERWPVMIDGARAM